MHRRAPVTLAVLTAALALAACSSAGDASPPTTAAPTTAATSTPPPTTAATTSAAPLAAAPSTTTSPAGGETVQAYFELLGLGLEPAEAACVAGELDTATLAALDAVVAEGAEAGQAAEVDVYAALLACEPASFVEAQVQAITGNTPATDEQARCVVLAANDRIAGDPALLELAAGAGDTGEWPAAQLEQLRVAVAACAPAELIATILRGSSAGG